MLFVIFITCIQFVSILYEYTLTCPTLMNALYNSYTCLSLFIGIIIYDNSCKHTIKMLPFHQTIANRQVGKHIKWLINHRFMHCMQESWQIWNFLHYHYCFHLILWYHAKSRVRVEGKKEEGEDQSKNVQFRGATSRWM